MSAKITREMLFSTGSSESQSQSTKRPSGGIVELDLARVIDSPYQPRKRRIDRRDVEELMASIEAAGQLQPIIVSAVDGDEAGTYHVHAGHRRCSALRFLGRSSVRAEIRELEPREARKLALAENLGREDLSGVEQAEALSAYAQDYEIPFADAARELGISERTRKRLGPLLKLPSVLRDEMLMNGISARVAEVIAKLERARPGIGVRRVKSFVDGTTTVAKMEREVRQLRSAQTHDETRVLSSTVSCDIGENHVEVRIRIMDLASNVERIGEAIDAMEKCTSALRERFPTEAAA